MCQRIAAAVIVAVGLAVGGTGQAATVVLSNNPSPGDAFTNAGPANQGQAVGASGWYYNNVRNGATVGISTAYPRNGNGSAAFTSLDGTDKADIEFLPGAVNVSGNFVSGGSLGQLSALTGFGYEWYRDSSSTTTAHLHPVIRVLLDADGDLATLGDRGGLVFERVYNGGGVVDDAWVADTVASTTNLWNFGLGIGFAANINASPYAYDATLAEWQAYFPDAVILGFSSGVGSGWGGTFSGAVDGINWTVAGSPTVSANFEVAAVPEPATLAILGLGLLGLAAVRRRA